PTAVAMQTLWTPVAMKRLLAGRAGRLPIAGLHDGVVRGITCTRNGTDSPGHRLPLWSMPSRRASQSMSDFVQQCVADLFPGIVQGVEPSDLDAFCPIFAHAQPSLRVGPAKCPAMQSVLAYFLVGNGFQFVQIHDLFRSELIGGPLHRCSGPSSPQ